MDLKVYEKEEVLQPSGTEYVYVPDVIDIYPEYKKEQASQNCTLTEFIDGSESYYVFNLDTSKDSECNVIVYNSLTSTVAVYAGNYSHADDSLEVLGVTIITNVSDNINTVLNFTSYVSEVTLSVTEDRSVINFDNTKSGTYYVLTPSGNALIMEQLDYNSVTDTLTLADMSKVYEFSSTILSTETLGEVEVSEIEYLDNAVVLTDENDLIEQECALATIWQKGNDPVDTDEGISWSECLLGEINVVQIMQQLVEAVQKITLTVKVSFDAVTDNDGQTFLSYTLKAVG